MAVPPEIDLRFATVAEASRQLAAWQATPEPRPAPHRRRGDHGRAPPRRIRRWCGGSISAAFTIGPGRRERLPYLYLTDEELRCLVALEAEGAEITAQDLPTTSPVALRAIA